MINGQKHILIVDDEPDIISIIELILNRAGQYAVSSASNGLRALEFLVGNPTVDLVLADIKMPEMDGVELINKIKDINVETPKVMFVTGFTSMSFDKLYDAGACGFIMKPFEWGTVLSSVEECFRKSPCYDRIYNQFDVKLNITMELESLEAVHAFSQDFGLGRGGMFLNSSKNMAGIGDLVRFRVDFKRGTVVKIEGVGVVVWQRILDNEDILLGIKFHNLKPEIEHIVEDFCHKNKVKAFIPTRK